MPNSGVQLAGRMRAMRSRRFRLGLDLGAALVLMTMAFGAAFGLQSSEQTTRQTTASNLERTAQVLEKSINNRLLQVDSSLSSVRSLLNLLGRRDGGVTPQAASALLQGLEFQSQEVRDLLLMLPDGRIWAHARPLRENAPYFVTPADLAASQGPGSALLSPPRLNPLTGEWAMVVARSLSLPELGQLLVLAEVPLSNFSNAFAAVGPVPGMRIQMETTSGVLVASYPPDILQIGKVQAPAVGDVLAAGRSMVSVNGKENFAAARQSIYEGLVLGAFLDKDIALSEWRRDRDRLLMGVGGTALLFLLFVAAIQFFIARQGRSDDALIERDRLLDQQNLRFDAALNNMTHALIMVDAAGAIAVFNRQFAAVLGVPVSELRPGMLLGEALDKALSAGRLDRDLVHQARTSLCSPPEGDGIAQIVEMSGSQALAVSRQPMTDGGWVAVIEDVTTRRAAENRIRFLAHYDDLTKLPNRVKFQKQTADWLRAGHEHGAQLALFYLDLDRFKDVNDRLGHGVGDVLLKQVAQRLKIFLRKGDIVARLGGDEFAIVVPVESPDEAKATARRVIDVLSAPYDLHGHEVVIGASVGIALSSGPAPDPDELLRKADMALYHAKGRGRGSFCVFEPELEEQLNQRLQLEADLRSAVEQGQFWIAYQPVFKVSSFRASGAEALVRWNHPVRGLVSPAEFIPVAEELGVISDIGAWVLRQACIEVVAGPPGMKVAVNISPVQLRSDRILGDVRSALQVSGLCPSCLELEITEGALLQEDERILQRLHDLKALGVSIVLDDFGTGYSSLSHLRLFPFDKIKIDQTFVREMTTRPDCEAIVRAVVRLAGDLGMTTTAEGVETPEHLAAVRGLGCTEAQGYLLGRPEARLPTGERVRFSTA